MVSIPKLKTTFSQGDIIAELLKTTGEKEINSIPYVYKKMSNYIANRPQGKEYPGELEDHIEQEHSRAIAYCEVLELISEQRDEIMLTFFGNRLLTALNGENIRDIFNAKYSDLLGRIYIEIDNQKWKILDVLSSLPNPVKLQEITTVLINRGVDLGLKPASRRRIRKKMVIEFESELYWQDLDTKISEILEKAEIQEGQAAVKQLLAFYKGTQLVIIENGEYGINEHRISNLVNTPFWNIEPFKRSRFLIELQSAYENWSTKLKLNDVPIPYLRQEVCRKLDIPWRRFDEILTKLPIQIGQYVLAFSQSRFPEKWGIQRVEKSMYYLSIIKREVRHA